MTATSNLSMLCSPRCAEGSRQDTLDQHTDPWGIKVSLVEIKGVDLPDNMQRAMARQAEAEREKGVWATDMLFLWMFAEKRSV